MKTLKDIPTNLPNGMETKGSELVNREDLRQAAIEWVKELRKDRGCSIPQTIDGVVVEDCSDFGNEFCMSSKGLEKWIMNFFGITEDELR